MPTPSRCKSSNRSAFALIALWPMLGVTAAAHAQEGSAREGFTTTPAESSDASRSRAADSEYKQPFGEQPVYGRKYFPTSPSADIYLEVNPLLLVRRGLSAEFEKRGGDKWSYGADVQFTSARLYDAGGVTGSHQFVGLAPKFRIYPRETLAGVFFGTKLLIGQSLASISDANEKQDDSQLVFTPGIHFGYRFVTFGGFTVAAYVGGGLNIPRPVFESSELPAGLRASTAANDARVAINRENGVFKPDFGLTLGIAL